MPHVIVKMVLAKKSPWRYHIWIATIKEANKVRDNILKGANQYHLISDAKVVQGNRNTVDALLALLNG